MAVVRVPTLTTVRESQIASPPLLEPASVPAPAPRTVAATAAAGPPRNSGKAAAAPIVATPATPATPVRDAVMVEAPRVESPEPVAVPPPAPVEAWQGLRDALGACSRSSGVWERATCEQRARLAHCDGHWGSVALCPSGRTDFGQ